MNRNLKLVVNNVNKDENKKLFFERTELKIILDLYAKWFRREIGKIMGFQFLENK